ncbi:LysM peptidoglycan-binding domain-containing protein [uncultured Algibacter sp.]|uniref:PBP1 and LysM peptidoglycan-binding domain-containing protein n=1 Tax=uncultured Algibacter sp. TaxID=298659 RepID=UPI003216E789
MKRYLLVFILVFTFCFTSVEAQNFKTHQVKKGETVESIAEKYTITVSEIYSLNPDAKIKLKPNTVLIIPTSKSQNQETKVKITKELQGFKEHKTRRKETLYSLSKKYNVGEDEIKKYNKFLYANPLRKGDRLQIPKFKVIEVLAKATMPYKVKPKEGKWRIAYKFGITLEEFEKLNPDIEDVLKDGQVVNVPNLDIDEVNVFDEKYSYYKVLPKEGFYRLKVKLGLEKDQLEALNPELKESGLKDGMILKIPFTEKVTEIENNEMEIINLKDSISDFNTKHIAVMLPFRMDRVDFDSIVDAKQSIKKDPYLNASLDFYSGVLMALDALKELGVSLNVDVYDTKYQASEVTKIIKDNNFENVDAVIGPLTPASFDKAASALRSYNTPVVSPIGTGLKLYDNVFQSRPSDDMLEKTIVNFVKKDSLSNVIIISDTKTTKAANMLKGQFNNAKQVFSRKSKKGKDEFFVTKEDIMGVLTSGKNVVFLETKNKGLASNVTSILASLIKNSNSIQKGDVMEVMLTTTNMNSAFEGDQINNTHLSKLQFHFATTSKEYSENDNNDFVKKYNKLYNITPNKRAVRGYDLTMDVVLRLVSSGDLYMSVNKAPLTEYVENKFAYKKKPFGGYYNDTVYLVKYNDLTIVEVK